MHDEIEKELEKAKAVILDMDGVVYIGDSAIEGSREAIKNLRGMGSEIIFLTNNSTRTRSDYRKKLSRLEIDCSKDEIMTSSYATTLYLSERGEGEKCFVIGEEGLKKELTDAGFEIVSRKNAEEASFVVAGMDRGLSYEKIWGGLIAILSGADFIATNPDTTYCTEKGLAPGAAASIGALSATAEEKPTETIGKPSTYMLKVSLDMIDVSPEEAVIIGDRINTDIKAGKRLGLTTILVLSGVDTEEELEDVKGSEKEPDFVMQSLKDLAT